MPIILSGHIEVRHGKPTEFLPEKLVRSS
jgi:hypothetical protein